MTKIWIKVSLIPIFSLFLAQCAGGGGTGAADAHTVIPDPAAAPVIPAPIPAPTPDPEPGPVDPGLNAPVISATEGVYADRIEISWQPIPGANYKVYRKLASASAYTLIHSGTEPIYSDTTASAGSTYQYAVKASNAQGQNSAISEFDTGWRAFSEGCSEKLNADRTDSRIGVLRNGFRDASAIAIRANHFFIAGGGRIVMLNGQRDLVGLWPNAGSIAAMTVAPAGGPVYALAGKRILKLTDSCETETFATLPYNTAGFDITIDTSGNIYVSEYTYDKTPRIFRYDANANLINEWSFPNGTIVRSLNAIQWLPDNSIVVADRTLYKIQKYQINGTELIKVAEKNMAVIGEPTDIATYGTNILLFTKSNDTMHLTRYHSGFDGGSVTYDIGSNWRMHVTEAAINPANGTLYATDETGRQLLACPTPLFICSRESSGAAPVGITSDAQKNLYVLHGPRTGAVTKLNANGAHLGARILPDYQNRAVTPYGIEADGDFLYISATNGQTPLILKIKNDLSGNVTFTERTGNGESFFDVAASAGRIVSEQRVGYVSGEDYLTKAVFEALHADGSKVQLPDYVLPENIVLAMASKVETCAADSLYFQITGYADQLLPATFLARLATPQNSWVSVALPAGQPRITEFRCAKTAGTLFSLDSDATGNLSVAQRDAELSEIRRFGAGRGMIGRTFAVSADGLAAYAATPGSIHRFAPAQVSVGSQPQ
jgi:hypothetical protein